MNLGCWLKKKRLHKSARFFASALLLCVASTLFPPKLMAQNAPSAAQVSEPAAVVRALIEAMHANDSERIRSFFAANASQAYGGGPSKSGPAFFAWLNSDIIERKGVVDDPQFSANGSEVIVRGQFRNNRGYRSAANFRFLVENSRIVSWQMRY